MGAGGLDTESLLLVAGEEVCRAKAATSSTKSAPFGTRSTIALASLHCTHQRMYNSSVS